MGRESSLTESDDDENATAATNTSTNELNSKSIRDRFRFKRNNNNNSQEKFQSKPSIHRYLHRHRYVNRFNRKGLMSLFPFMIVLVVFAFAMASMVLQSSIASVFGSERGWPVREELRFGRSLKFVQSRVGIGDGLDRFLSKPRFGVRLPRVDLILGNRTKDPQSLMLISVVKNLQRLGYVFKYLTGLCCREWCSPFIVGANRRSAFYLRSGAIWPY